MHMRFLSALFALLPFSSFAVLHIVQSGGSTIGSTDPYYSPQFLTINVGDQVRWENQSGTHNVNGTLATFPSNPQGFTSGDTQSGNWNWTFTFTIPGVYNYHCDGQGHAATQFGTITVLNSTTGLAQVPDAADGITLFPSPANEQLTVKLGGFPARELTIIDLNGQVVMSQGTLATEVVMLNVSGLKPANYFLLVTDHEGRVSSKPFTKS